MFPVSRLRANVPEQGASADARSLRCRPRFSAAALASAASSLPNPAIDHRHGIEQARLLLVLAAETV
jgi:hypothetical protein